MPQVAHIATLAAYPIKESLGGGFRGVFFIRETKERKASDRFDTLEQARYWAQSQAWDHYAKVPGFSVAPIRKRGEYQANVWVAA